MIKSVSMILKGAVISVFIFCTTARIEAQTSSTNDSKRKTTKNAENTFKVTLSEDEKNPLNLKVNINNTLKENVKVYLRKRNDFTFLFEKLLGKESKLSMTLEFAPLKDDEYTFVVKTETGFFLKNISLQSGDLATIRISGRDVMTINRTITLSDE
jgi:hypothetical protein